MKRQTLRLLATGCAGLALLAIPSVAAAGSQVQASGTVDWSAFANFRVTSAEVVISGFVFDEGDADGGVDGGGGPSFPEWRADATNGSYSVVVTPAMAYWIRVYLSDCDSEPATCGDPGRPGTRVRYDVPGNFSLPDGETSIVQNVVVPGEME